MSINVFADRRIALGFGGAIAAIAMIAGLSMGGVGPRNRGAERFDSGVAEVDNPVANRRATAPTSAWVRGEAGADPVSDDWAGPPSANSAAAFATNGPSLSGNDHAAVPEFGAYRPAERPARPAQQVHQSGGGEDGPVIYSRAAPDAPALKPPGNS